LQLAFDPNQERQFHFPISLSLFLDDGVLHMTTVLFLVGSRTFVFSEEISRHIFARCEGPLRKGSICREETMHPLIKSLLVVRGVEANEAASGDQSTFMISDLNRAADQERDEERE
jgi:hypothetical protein